MTPTAMTSDSSSGAPSDVSKCTRFLSRLIQTPSMSGEEGGIADLVSREMETLGYHSVEQDAVGNVIGLVQGRGEAPSVMFNTHLDHVDPGDPADWPHPPYGGEVHDGVLWGRGAVDIKGPLAAQVYGVARLVAEGERPPGDVYVTAVVQEEVGGLGARYLAQNLHTDLVLIGEPSRNEVRRGHRGRVELQLRVGGRMSHASMTHIGRNPLTVVGRFLGALPDVTLPSDPDLGSCTIAPTIIGTDQTSPNVIPGEARLTLDCRTVAGQTAESLRDLLLPTLAACAMDGTTADILIPQHDRVTYTGLAHTYPADNPALSCPEGHPAVVAAVEVLAGPLGARPPVDTWDFATDGGHFANQGMTVVGFGPGDDRLAHTVSEYILLEDLALGIAGNEALARDWPSAVAA